MTDFSFIGRIPPSRKIFARSLVIKSYFSDFIIKSELIGKDVCQLDSCLEDIKSKSCCTAPDNVEMLLFLIFRCSRNSGEVVIEQANTKYFTNSLFRDTAIILNQLGAFLEKSSNGKKLTVRSKGWALHGDGIFFHSPHSDLIASALLLNTWDLNFDLPITLPGKMKERVSFDLTYQLLQKNGWNCHRTVNEFEVKKNQKIDKFSYEVEPEMSICFLVGALAAIAGTATITNFPDESIQPGSFFPYVLEDAGGLISFKDGHIQIKKASPLLSFEADLSDTDEMLALTAALAGIIGDGDSFITDVEWGNLIQKSEWEKFLPLLEAAGCRVLSLENSIRIKGSQNPMKKAFVWDIANSPRLLLVAVLLKWSGWKLQVENYELAKEDLRTIWKVIGWE